MYAAVVSVGLRLTLWLWGQAMGRAGRVVGRGGGGRPRDRLATTLRGPTGRAAHAACRRSSLWTPLAETTSTPASLARYMTHSLTHDTHDISHLGGASYLLITVDTSITALYDIIIVFSLQTYLTCMCIFCFLRTETARAQIVTLGNTNNLKLRRRQSISILMYM